MQRKLRNAFSTPFEKMNFARATSSSLTNPNARPFRAVISRRRQFRSSLNSRRAQFSRPVVSKLESQLAKMEERTVEWKWEGATFQVPCDVRGDGKRALLMLPSINMASCRKELRPVTALLAPSFRSYALDWPGFGEASRLNVNYSPEMFAAFVLHAVQSVIGKETVDVVACGHASGYVLRAAEANPKLWSRIALVAPTYRVSPAAGI